MVPPFLAPEGVLGGVPSSGGCPGSHPAPCHGWWEGRAASALGISPESQGEPRAKEVGEATGTQWGWLAQCH